MRMMTFLAVLASLAGCAQEQEVSTPASPCARMAGLAAQYRFLLQEGHPDLAYRVATSIVQLNAMNNAMGVQCGYDGVVAAAAQAQPFPRQRTIDDLPPPTYEPRLPSVGINVGNGTTVYDNGWMTTRFGNTTLYNW